MFELLSFEGFKGYYIRLLEQNLWTGLLIRGQSMQIMRNISKPACIPNPQRNHRETATVNVKAKMDWLMLGGWLNQPKIYIFIKLHHFPKCSGYKNHKHLHFSHQTKNGTYESRIRCSIHKMDRNENHWKIWTKEAKRWDPKLSSWDFRRWWRWLGLTPREQGNISWRKGISTHRFLGVFFFPTWWWKHEIYP